MMLLGFVLLGRFLEERARFRTGQALHQLAQLQPDTARWCCQMVPSVMLERCGR